MHDTPQLTITLKHALDSVTVTLVGELDLAVEGVIRETIRDLVANNDVLASMCIDVTRVTFLDSSGLRSLMRAHLTAREYGLAFTLTVAPKGPVVRIIELSGLETWFGLPGSEP